MGIERTHLRPVDRTTISAIIVKVALSPVAMLMIARMLRRQLKGLAAARKRRTSGVTGAVEESTFGPCVDRAWETSSEKSPVGLEGGKRLKRT
jgi:hypothetical protein